MFLLVLLTFVGVMWVGCYSRKLPTVVMRGWFAATLLLAVAVSNVVTGIVMLARICTVGAKRLHGVNAAWMGSIFAVVLHLNPQITIHIDDSELSLRDGIPPRSVILSNHTSFMDSVLIPSILPHHVNYKIRTLYKHQLGNVPVFGPIMHRTGNFPVYFTRNESKSFTVDQAKQAVVTEKVEAHVTDDHGVLLLYPEGRINENPETLLSFRTGTFKVIHEHRPAVVGCVIVGDSTTWPNDAPIGGLPADIFVKLFPIEMDYDGAGQLLQLTECARERMQHHLTELVARAAGARGETIPLRGSFGTSPGRLERASY